MSLKSTVQNAAVTAFNAIGDIAVKCTYKELSDAVYTPGSPIARTFVAQNNLSFLFEEYTLEQKEANAIPAESMKASIPTLNFNGKPKQDSQIIDNATAKVWKVVNVETDPAQALWEIQVMPDSRPEFV